MAQRLFLMRAAGLSGVAPIPPPAPEAMRLEPYLSCHVILRDHKIHPRLRVRRVPAPRPRKSAPLRAARRAAACGSPAVGAPRRMLRMLTSGKVLRALPLPKTSRPARGTRRVRLVRGEGRGVST